MGTLWRWNPFSLLTVSVLSTLVFEGRWPLWPVVCGAFAGWQIRRRFFSHGAPPADRVKPINPHIRSFRMVVSRVAGVLSWGLLGYSLFALSVAWSCARNDSRLPHAWGALANGQGPWVGYSKGVFLLEHTYMMLFWSVVLAHLAFFADRCRRSFLLLTVSFATGFSVVASHNWLITGLDRR